MSAFRRIYEYAGGDWREDNGVPAPERLSLLSLHLL